jgi:hypothetical protein
MGAEKRNAVISPFFKLSAPQQKLRSVDKAFICIKTRRAKLLFHEYIQRDTLSVFNLQ